MKRHSSTQRTSCDDRGRDWRDKATSQETLSKLATSRREAQDKFSLRVFRRNQLYRLDFRLLAI